MDCFLLVLMVEVTNGFPRKLFPNKLAFEPKKHDNGFCEDEEVKPCKIHTYRLSLSLLKPHPIYLNLSLSYMRCLDDWNFEQEWKYDY